jgi:DNA-binding XRE family transcriptional regulator
MKRKLSELTEWNRYEKQLLNDKKFIKEAEKVEYEYELAKSLIELRKKNNITQVELAERVGTKQPVISRVETGTVKPSISLLERIAYALGANLEVRFRD